MISEDNKNGLRSYYISELHSCYWAK